MRITTKLIIVLSPIVMLVATVVSYSLTSNELTTTMSYTILILSVLALAALGIFLTRNILQPIKKLTRAGQQLATGNLSNELYRGKIDADKIARSDELSQLVLAFESMRRRLVYLNSGFNKLSKEKNLVLERAHNALVENERALQRTNAMLAGQSEELKIMNDGLSAKNKELSEAYTKLQQLDKMKTEFIMIAAHELRTPLQPIMGFVELAEKGSISIDQAWKVIASEAKRLACLSSDLLDAGTIENGTFAYDMKPIGVRGLVELVSASSSKFATPDRIVAISTDIDTDVKIMGDKKRLIQALENIVNNAVKFGENGAIAIQTRNDYDIGVVELRISDDGPGIPPEILPVLFNKFVTRTEANQRGSGLGLFITKAIIEAHNGKVTAANNGAGGKGATFTISLPVYNQSIPLQTN